MKRIAMGLALAFAGCTPLPPPGPKVVQVPLVSAPAAPVPAPEMVEGYELETLDLNWNGVRSDADAARQALRGWLEAHRDRKVISIIPIPSGGNSNYLTQLLIVSFKGKPVEPK